MSKWKTKTNNLRKYFKGTVFWYFVTYDHHAQLRIQKFDKNLMKTRIFHTKLRNLKTFVYNFTHICMRKIFVTFVPVLSAYLLCLRIVPNCIINIIHV